jgi:hypothetical protein
MDVVCRQRIAWREATDLRPSLFVQWVEKYKAALAGDGMGEWESRDDGDAGEEIRHISPKTSREVKSAGTMRHRCE